MNRRASVDCRQREHGRVARLVLGMLVLHAVACGRTGLGSGRDGGTSADPETSSPHGDAADQAPRAADSPSDPVPTVADALDGSRRALPGTVAWTHSGRPTFDPARRLYTSGGGYMNSPRDLWRVDPGTGTDVWTLQFDGEVCLVGDGVVYLPRDGRAIKGLSATDGSALWDVPSNKVSSHHCGAATGLVFTVEDDDLGVTNLRAYGTGDGALAWQNRTARPTNLAWATSEFLYAVRSSIELVDLAVLSIADGGESGHLGFPTGSKLHFGDDGGLSVVEEQGLLVSLHADGTVAYTYLSPAKPIDVSFESAADFVVVTSAAELVALDRATGEKLWVYEVVQEVGEGAWHASITKSGDAIIVVRDAGPTVVLGHDGRERWTTSAELCEPGAGELYTVGAGRVSRVDRETGKPLWSRSADAETGAITGVLGVHGEELLLLGVPQAGAGYLPHRTVLSLRKSDGRFLWKSERRVTGDLVAADDERIYLWGGPDTKYDLHGVTTAIWHGDAP